MNPCIDYCFNHFGKEYTKDCDNNCEYAKVIVENKKLQAGLSRMTNADRIRAMSNEELAVFLESSRGCPTDDDCEYGVHATPENCIKHWDTWLQQPAKEDT